MLRTIRARFSHGVIEPLEKVEMPEGKEITITISRNAYQRIYSRRRTKRQSMGQPGAEQFHERLE